MSETSTAKKGNRFAPAIFAQLCLVLLLGLAGGAKAVDWRNLTPLPDEMKIESPGPGVSPAIAKLSGVWQGALAC